MIPLGTYIVGVTAFLLTFICWRFYQWRKDLPPGPPCLPFIGNIGMVDLSDSVAEFRRLRQKYGDVFCFVIGQRPVVVVNGVEALRDIMVKKADVTSSRPADFPLSQLAKWKGITASNGELWKEHRSFALRTLRGLGFGKRSLESQIQHQIEILLQKIDDTKCQPFDIHQPLQMCIGNIICSIIMGRTFDNTNKKLLSLMAFIEKLFADSSNRGISSFVPFREYIPGDPFHTKDRRKFMHQMQSFFQDIIDEHKRTLDKGNIRDYVDAFLVEKDRQSSDPNSTFDDEQLRETLRDLFIAGHETTVTTIRWVIIQLIHHPDIQTKMRKEIEQVAGLSLLPSLSQQSELPYTEAVITETLRLNQLLPLSAPHGVSSDVYWRGYRIPVDAQIIPCLDSVAMDPKIFPNPEKFDPDRFLDSKGTFNKQHVLLPFGIGRRVCLGEALARMELFLFTAAIVQRFELLPEDENKLPSLKGVFSETFFPLQYKIRAIHRE